MTVTNTWMNTHTELELPTVPVVWFNTALCEDIGKTIVQKLWMLEQMDCGRAGLVQEDIRTRMKAGESLVDLMAPMTSTMASMVDSLVVPLDVSLVALMASMVASKASVVASMASVVASMASMASLVEPRKWLQRRAAEPERDDERVKGLAHSDELTLKIDGALTVAMVIASMAATMVAPEASMVASMALLVASLASMASIVASLDRLRLMIEPRSGEERIDGLSHKICEERADGLTHKICEERADGLTHKICEERADELTMKIDGERVGRLTHIIREERVDGLIKIKIDGERVERLTRKIREERVDGLTFKIDEEGADGWSAKTGEERADGWTYRKVVEQMLVEGDGSESGGCNLAQVTPPLNYKSVQFENGRNC